MDLSIITVTHNDSGVIARQLESIKQGAKNIEIEQWVVDNGSKDETVRIVENNFPHVHLIKNLDNKGFGAANNMAERQATGEFILFLNPDMQVLPQSLDRIVFWMRNRPDIGIASCKLIDEKGEFNESARPRRFPKVSDQLAIIFKLHHFFPGLLNKYLYKDFDTEKEQEVDTVRGSFMLMRKSFIKKIGFAFDPRYFIWFEDVDICRECWKNDLKVVYTPLISCIDFVGQSFKKKPTLWKQKNFTKSMLQYFKKWEPWRSVICISMARPFGLFLALIAQSFNNIYEKIKR